MIQHESKTSFSAVVRIFYDDVFGREIHTVQVKRTELAGNRVRIRRPSLRAWIAHPRRQWRPKARAAFGRKGRLARSQA